MDAYQQVGAQLRAFLEAFMGGPADAGPSTRIGAASASDGEARRRRQNPLRVPDSRHYAAVLAYGNFILTEGMNIRCEAIQGLSGVKTLPQVATQANGHPEVQLERYLTHFYFADPSVVIEQNPHKRSTGYLRGATRGGAEALLPGRASFSQFLILQLDGKPLANREPLVMPRSVSRNGRRSARPSFRSGRQSSSKWTSSMIRRRVPSRRSRRARPSPSPS